jgi:hypothetical protein
LFCPCATGVVGVDPGAEALGLQVGELQQQVGHVAFGVNQDAGHPIQGSLFQQTDTQAGFAAAGHSYAHRMGRQVACIVDDWRFAAGCAGEIILCAQVKRAEFFRWGLHCCSS